MKVNNIIEGQPVFRHKSGAVETLDDYGRKLVKRANKAGKRLRHLAKNGFKGRVRGDTGERPAVNESEQLQEATKTIKVLKEMNQLSTKYRFAIEEVDGNRVVVAYKKRNNKMAGSFDSLDNLLDTGLGG